MKPSTLPEQKITVVSYEEKSQACLTDEIVEKFDLNSEAESVLQWNTIDGLECLDIASLEGMSVTPNLSTGTLIINIPKSYQEYSTTGNQHLVGKMALKVLFLTII